MKVLWLCNMMLPNFAHALQLPVYPIGGWLSGMFNAVKSCKNIQIDLAFPLYAEETAQSTEYDGHNYYCFNTNVKDINENPALEAGRLVPFFCDVLNKAKPDVIHVWGTEYPHSLACVLACQKLGLASRVLVNIQGLVSVLAQHYFTGVPQMDAQYFINGRPSILKEKLSYEKRGKCEIELLKQVQHVSGRTEWDKACCLQINPQLQYHYCGEILREAFYKNNGTWQQNACIAQTILVSNASYPVKGLHFLLEALPNVIKAYPNTKVLICGHDIIDVPNNSRSPYGQYLANLVEEYGLQSYLSFIGPQNEEEMCKQFLAANVFVCPSTVENSANSICEALMLGTPVVASFVGGTPSIIKHEQNGYLYPADETYMLAHYIIKIFNEPETLAQFAKEGTKTAMRFNGKEESLNALKNAYTTILEKNV
jgi:glycosyltransferase involved in cell wall biosynthesis